jgi:hypothetical protein
MKKIFYLLVLSLAFFAGCQISQPTALRTSPWQSLYSGIDFATGDTNVPRLQKVYVVRIDLNNPNIEFISTPPDDSNNFMTCGQRTSEFLEKYGCTIAINANPFSPVDQSRPRNIFGLAVSNGKIVSKANPSNHSLIITKDNRASIEVTDANTDLRDVWTAVSGFKIMLSDGINIADNNTIHPRSAVGISKNNRFLYLMVIDGRQIGYSQGATLYETAEWLKRFGAYDGLNLDGGGSTSLVRSDDKGSAVIINRPIHGNIPGTERIVGNNLGVILLEDK